MATMRLNSGGSRPVFWAIFRMFLRRTTISVRFSLAKDFQPSSFSRLTRDSQRGSSSRPT